MIGKYKARGRLRGHADRAAKALALAATQGYTMLVFVKDVDKTPGKPASAHERRRLLKKTHDEIEAGFADVDDAEGVLRVKATPCRMLEAWALGDGKAFEKVAGANADRSEVPPRPEELWGQEADASSRHPKCTLRRALGDHPGKHVFEHLAQEADPATLRATCPQSFAPFADEVERARDRWREGRPSAVARRRRGRG